MRLGMEEGEMEGGQGGGATDVADQGGTDLGGGGG